MKYIILFSLLSFINFANATVTVDVQGAAVVSERVITIEPEACVRVMTLSPDKKVGECEVVDAAVTLAHPEQAQITYDLNPAALSWGNDGVIHTDDMIRSAGIFTPLPNGYRFRLTLGTFYERADVRDLDMEAGIRNVILNNGGRASFRAIIVSPAAQPQ